MAWWQHTSLIGTIEFGGTIVEDIFGVKATVITFTSEVSRFNGTDLSEASGPHPFLDLIYRSTSNLTFGAGSPGDPATVAPTALNVSLLYTYLRPADPTRLN